MKQTQNHFLKFANSQIENDKKMMICFDGNIDAGVNVSIDESDVQYPHWWMKIKHIRIEDVANAKRDDISTDKDTVEPYLINGHIQGELVIWHLFGIGRLIGFRQKLRN